MKQTNEKDNRNKERSGRLASAFGLIDEEIVKEAENEAVQKTEVKKVSAVSKSRKPLRIGLIAAAVILLVTGGIFAIKMINRQTDEPFKSEPIILSGNAYYSDGVTELPEALKSINVTADGMSSRLISPTATLCVTTVGKTDTETLAQYLSVYPEVPVSVTQKSDTEFLITPASGSFVPGTVYNIRLGDPENPASSYAFQTESELVIKTLLPADKGINVPADTGIEITFSESLDPEVQIADYFTVTPEIKGEWMLYPDGRTVAFIPEGGLKFNTEYEYTVKKGIKSASGRELKEGTTVRFRTAEETVNPENGYVYMAAVSKYTNLSACFKAGETPCLELNVNGSNLKSEISLITDVYKYASFDDAYDAIKKYETVKSDSKAEYPTSGLKHITEIKGYSAPDSYSHQAIDLPAGLEKGVYLLKVKASATGKNNKTVSISADYFIQVTDMQAYTVSSDGTTLILLYSEKSGPVTGAKLTGEKYTAVDCWSNSEADFSKAVFTESGNGVYVTENSADTCILMKASKGDDSLLVCTSSERKDNGNYTMKYMYTDREVYFTNDTVNFRGFIAPAYTDSELPEELYLQTGRSSIRTAVRIDANGFFEGSFRVEDMSAGNIVLKITDADGKIISAKNVRVTEEEKPQITASITFDRLFYRYGETINATLKATFFDGTPAPGLSFSFSSSDFSVTCNNYNTDANGEISVSIKTGRPSHAYSTSPETISLYAQLTGFETQSLYISKEVLYFHSDYIFSTVWNTDSRQLTLYRRDTSSIKSAEDLQYPAFPQNTVGEPAEGKVSYTLVKYVITKTQKQQYDTYTKRSYIQYNYKTTETVEKTGEFSFRNGVIDLPMYEVSGFTGGYYYNITYNDGRNTYETSVSAVKNSTVTNPSVYNRARYSIELNKSSYSAGDSISARLDMNGETVDTVFWILSANGIKSYCFGKNFTETYSEDMVPGATLYAVYMYNGEFMYTGVSVTYDYEGNASLNIEITPDRTAYKPGEDAKVTVKVTDSKGNPVTSGKILLSIVDEACFALGDQTVNVPESFFTSLGKEKSAGTTGYYYSYYYSTSYDKKPVSLNNRKSVCNTETDSDNGAYLSNALQKGGAMPAEMPDEINNSEIDADSTYIRETFSNNPVFYSFDLGSDGTGTYIFKVPDNITSWRITACAESGKGKITDIKVGNAVTDVICTQSFFINAGICSRYIEGDDISVSARSYGSDASGKISYTAILYSEDGTELKRVNASADAQIHAWINFGKLPEGRYSAVISGSNGKNSDALRVSFDVTKTAAVTAVSRDITPDELKALNPLTYPVTLTFHANNGGFEEISRVFSRILYRNDAGRSDSLAARFTALSVYSRLYGQKLDENPDELKKLFKNYLRGCEVSLLQYSSSDRELTARILAVCPELFGSDVRDSIISVYSAALGKMKATDDTALCAVLLSLASLGEPVLDRLYSVASQAKNFSLEAKLYLCGAFAAIGDYSAASDIWAQLKEENGVADSEYGTLYIKADNLQEQVRRTSLALIACSRFSKTDATALVKYLLGNVTGSESDGLALAAYLKYFTPAGKADEVHNVTYTLAGKTQTVEISRKKSFTLVMTKSEFAEFSIDSIDDGITVHATYGGTAEEAYSDKIDSSRVSIEKSIRSAGNGMFDVTLKISGTSTRVSECFTVRDWIPSGARYFVTRGGYGNSKRNGVSVSGCIYNTSGQQMNGYVCIYNNAYIDRNLKGQYENTCPEYSFSIDITYRIRGAVAGEFIIEPAIISNPATSLYSMSERMTVTISDPFSDKWEII